jgi:hypothetical protein
VQVHLCALHSCCCQQRLLLLPVVLLCVTRTRLYKETPLLLLLLPGLVGSLAAQGAAQCAPQPACEQGQHMSRCQNKTRRK